jgi:hypothetical protein
MFGIPSRRRQSLTTKPSNRTRLQCEQLGERVNPTVTGTFSASGMLHVSGEFTLDETLLDYDDPEQVIPLGDFELGEVGPWNYTINEDPVEAVFQYGRFHSMEFTASGFEDDGDPAPGLTVEVVENTATAWISTNPNPFILDVSVAIAPSGTIDFTSITTGQHYWLQVSIWNAAGTDNTNFIIEVGESASAATIRDQIYTQALAAGFTVAKNANEVTITGSSKIEMFATSTASGPEPVPNFTRPTLTAKSGDFKLYVNNSLVPLD